ncbi:MAG: BolA family transcriptional regulator [Alphaproteobacteria bacterium]|nr:BolA family transcriptional regulator [Alphaproteobacteria bacterium]MDD9919457.1 BolA family transcriptional regulator [Alphaproteobacteria bacterium]
MNTSTTNLTQEIAEKIKVALPQAQVTVTDPMQDGAHLEALIICPSFSGQNRIQRHRQVYAALGDAFTTNLHALKITTKAPEEIQ